MWTLHNVERHKTLSAHYVIVTKRFVLFLFCDAVHCVTFTLWKLYALEYLRGVQLRFVALCHVTFTLCCFTLCSNIINLPSHPVHNANLATTTFEVFSILMPNGTKMFFSTVLRKSFVLLETYKIALLFPFEKRYKFKLQPILKLTNQQHWLWKISRHKFRKRNFGKTLEGTSPV